MINLGPPRPQRGQNQGRWRATFQFFFKDIHVGYHFEGFWVWEIHFRCRFAHVTNLGPP